MQQHGPRRWSRRHYLKGLATVAAGSLTSLPAPAKTPRPFPRFKRGMNIHNLLNWPEFERVGGQTRYLWPPFRSARYRIESSELRALAAAGFDFIRLTADPSILIAAGEHERPDLNRHARDIIDQLLGAGFNLVFDLHPVAVNPDYRPEALVASASSPAFMAYADMVGRVGALLRDLPPERVAFELFNEPWLGSMRDAPRWQGMIETLHERARQAAPEIALVLGGIQWNSYQGLLALDTGPFTSSNVLYTFHYYEPHAYTHQGAPGQDTAWIGGLNWPMDTANLDDVEAEAIGRIDAAPTLDAPAKETARADTRRYVASLRQNPPGPARITQDIDRLVGWAAAQGLGPERILLGEFGCTASAWDKPVGGRVAWLSAVRTACETAGIGWAYWAYKGSGMQFAREGGTFDPDAVKALGLSSPP